MVQREREGGREGERKGNWEARGLLFINLVPLLLQVSKFRS